MVAIMEMVTIMIPQIRCLRLAKGITHAKKNIMTLLKLDIVSRILRHLEMVIMPTNISDRMSFLQENILKKIFLQEITPQKIILQVAICQRNMPLVFTQQSVGINQNEGDYYNSPGYVEETGSARNSVPMQYSGMSPRSESSAKSDYTPTSAMRSAQGLLKKNREKRFLSSAGDKRTMPNKVDPKESIPFSPKTDDESQEEKSEFTSVVSGSSVWTDGSAGDRSSRRALILQMAKARMKSNKPPGESHAEDKTSGPIEEETSVRSGDDQPWEGGGGRVASEIDFTGDLD
jgi:hypothetical protein